MQPTAGQPDLCRFVKKHQKNLVLKKHLNIIILPFFMPTRNIRHIELPLLSSFDEGTPTESKLRSNLEIGPKMASKYHFSCFYTVL